MAAIRILGWEEAPLPWRLMLGHLTGDTTPRTHLAIVPAAKRTEWESPPVNWTGVLRTVVENPEGLEGVMEGDEMIAGNEPPPPDPAARQDQTPLAPGS